MIFACFSRFDVLSYLITVAIFDKYIIRNLARARQLHFLQFNCILRHTKEHVYVRIPRMEKTRRIAVAAERSSAYGRNFIRGIADVAERHAEWELVLVDLKSAGRKVADYFDGWICRVADARTAKALASSRRPVVDCLCARHEPTFATVKTDAEAIGRLAAEHLLKRHFMNFAFCGYRHVTFSDRRRNAFTSYLEDKGVRTSVYSPPLRRQNRFGRDFLLGDRIESPPDVDDLAKWIRRLPKPVGVFCCDDLRASHLAAVCRTLKLAVPSDVAILGVDDDPLYCMFATPRLSSIDPDATEIGRVAARTLASLFGGPALPRNPPTLTVPPKGIVERASTNTYPNAPKWFMEAISFVRSNATKGISATDVFRHVGVSRTLVERTFRTILISTVQREIADTRIAEAKRLLTSTSLPIKEIAGLSGFATLEYLSRTFAAATGRTPSAWREYAVPTS